MNQIHTLAAVMLLLILEPGELLPAFRDSVLSDKAPAAVEMISEYAIMEVDSVIENHPEQIAAMMTYFGIQTRIPDLEQTNGRELIQSILSSENFKASLLLFGITPLEPLHTGSGTFVPVTYGMFGNLDTLYIQLTEENQSWKIRDFFEILP